MTPREPVRDERAVAAYVERFGDTLTDAGMPRLASRVFACLLADDDGRMTAVELTEALDVSPAAISGSRALPDPDLPHRQGARAARAATSTSCRPTPGTGRC